MPASKAKRSAKAQMSELINEIEEIRKINNTHWMDILRIAMSCSPVPIKRILSKINHNDKEIGKLLGKLAK